MDNNTRTNHMEYMEGMEILTDSTVMDEVISAMKGYDYSTYTESDVLNALDKDTCAPEDFAAFLSPAAAPYLEQMAAKARVDSISRSITIKNHIKAGILF